MLVSDSKIVGVYDPFMVKLGIVDPIALLTLYNTEYLFIYIYIHIVFYHCFTISLLFGALFLWFYSLYIYYINQENPAFNHHVLFCFYSIFIWVFP